MKIYIVRHGQDDDSVRGGWSSVPLTETGIKQAYALANELLTDKKYNIGKIYSSDIHRAKQTAQIIADELNVSVEYLPEFREVNNGTLAGMNNCEAEKKYPNLFWRNLDWGEYYPYGESPKEFYERVCNGWYNFTESLANYDKNVLLVTHGGVINIVRCIENSESFSNKVRYQGIPCAKICFEVNI